MNLQTEDSCGRRAIASTECVVWSALLLLLWLVPSSCRQSNVSESVRDVIRSSVAMRCGISSWHSMSTGWATTTMTNVGWPVIAVGYAMLTPDGEDVSANCRFDVQGAAMSSEELVAAWVGKTSNDWQFFGDVGYIRLDGKSQVAMTSMILGSDSPIDAGIGATLLEANAINLRPCPSSSISVQA
jgi:hypothetical protein